MSHRPRAAWPPIAGDPSCSFEVAFRRWGEAAREAVLRLPGRAVRDVASQER
jgi:hypothetical protein